MYNYVSNGQESVNDHALTGGAALLMQGMF
jgi:hypothetical protein